MGEERIWYFYNGEAQVGPITESELKNQLAENALCLNDYVYRDGFSDWKLLADIPEFACLLQKKARERRAKAPRAPIYELVVAHNEVHVATGSLRNISETGVFFETSDVFFSLNDEIKLTLKEGRGLGKPLHLRGVVVRKAEDKRFPLGYGLELIGVDTSARQRIADYIKRHQQAS